MNQHEKANKIKNFLWKTALFLWKALKIYVTVVFTLCGFLYAVIDLFLGDGTAFKKLGKSKARTRNKANNKPDNPDLEDLKEKQGNDFLEEFDTIKSENFIEDMILEKIRKNPHKSLKETLSEEEMEILFMMFLRALGMTLE